jgi:hypothetical protein
VIFALRGARDTMRRCILRVFVDLVRFGIGGGAAGMRGGLRAGVREAPGSW